MHRKRHKEVWLKEQAGKEEDLLRSTPCSGPQPRARSRVLRRGHSSPPDSSFSQRQRDESLDPDSVFSGCLLWSMKMNSTQCCCREINNLSGDSKAFLGSHPEVRLTSVATKSASWKRLPGTEDPTHHRPQCVSPQTGVDRTELAKPAPANCRERGVLVLSDH